MTKKPPLSAGDAGDTVSVPGLGRSLGGGTHSSTLAWKIPWTEEPGRLQSMGPQRIRHNLMTEQQQKSRKNLSMVGHFPEKS